jgi:hypothetical protein
MVLIPLGIDVYCIEVGYRFSVLGAGGIPLFYLSDGLTAASLGEENRSGSPREPSSVDNSTEKDQNVRVSKRGQDCQV